MPTMPHARVASALAPGLAMMALACNANAPEQAAPADEATATAGVETAVGTAVATPPRAMMVEFSRDYCMPCQVMKPWVAEIANENPALDVLTLNVDRKQYEHIGSFFQVTAVPSLIFVGADGQVVRRSEGLAKKEQMISALRELGWAR